MPTLDPTIDEHCAAFKGRWVNVINMERPGPRLWAYPAYCEDASPAGLLLTLGHMYRFIFPWQWPYLPIVVDPPYPRTYPELPTVK